MRTSADKPVHKMTDCHHDLDQVNLLQITGGTAEKVRFKLLQFLGRMLDTPHFVQRLLAACNNDMTK